MSAKVHKNPYTEALKAPILHFSSTAGAAILCNQRLLPIS